MIVVAYYKYSYYSLSRTMKVMFLSWYFCLSIITIIKKIRVSFHLHTKNTLDCDQSIYSSRIVFSYIPIAFGPTGNSAIRSADPEHYSLESNIKWIGSPVAEISPFDFFRIFTAQCTLVHMRGLGIACRPSVRLSVRLSVCDVGGL